MEKRFLVGIVFIAGFFAVSLVLFSYLNFFYEPGADVVVQPVEQQPVQQEQPSQVKPEIPEPQTHFINLYQDRAEPNSLTINQGDTVVWLNKGSNRRRFWINEQIYSDMMEPGQSYSYLFEEPGTHKFRDVFNGNVVGWIKVEKVGAEPAAQITGNFLSGVPKRYKNVLALQLTLLGIGIVLIFYPHKKK